MLTPPTETHFCPADHSESTANRRSRSRPPAGFRQPAFGDVGQISAAPGSVTVDGQIPGPTMAVVVAARPDLSSLGCL